MTGTVIRVGGDASYDVTVGAGVSSLVPTALPDSAERVLLVHAPPLRAEAVALEARLSGTGRKVETIVVPDAEAGKTAAVLEECWSTLGRSDFTRSDVVVGIGGGAVTDLAGFVAASWLRGVAVVQVPTSLLAMVDAAIGGKTGINTPEGKNLVGAFHQPTSVWCDIDYLRTLPRHEMVTGLAEVVKAGFIRDLEILDVVESATDVLRARSAQKGRRGAEGLPVLEDLAARAIRVKADVVSRDPKEAFLREILNYGHTLGHAIEQVEEYRWHHGAAISVGMVFAAELARATGTLDAAAVDRHRTILGGLGLPIGYRKDRWDDLLAAMRRDKKTRGATLRFVVLDGVGNPVRLEGPDPELLRAAFHAIGE
jgi:3-dehydroquinate synthase